MGAWGEARAARRSDQGSEVAYLGAFLGGSDVVARVERFVPLQV